jgi:redox-sensitive bicupin YhaK (pirin superfamily)
MAITIVPKELQANGQFNGGAIMEKKPIGFPQDGGGGVKPYSNLFYWAHAWSDKGSLIGEHPHKGFEILSFVLEGDIEHYDSKLRGWKPLKKGDAQIIRAGNGISHAEKVNAKSEIFQIWFDPNLEKTLTKPATYNDYPDAEFPVTKQNGMTIKTFKGENSPLQMDTEGVSIKEFTLSEGQHKLPLDKNSVYSVFVVGGTVLAENNLMKKGDYAIIKEIESANISASVESKLFVIETPLSPSYRTYAEMYM